MAKYTRHQTIQTCFDQGMVPLFYHPDAEVGKQVLRACYDGGARLLEFTNRGDFAHEPFAELCRYAHAELPGMVMGVGSIVDAPTAALFLQLGADFIVSASWREDVARLCNRRKVLYAPGCGSLTEIGQAEELGCELVKLFPGSTYGPNFIKSVMAPQPWTRIMPTGGVAPTRENLSGWFAAGAVCVGMGSKLMKKHPDGSFDLAGIEATTREALRIIRELRA